MGAGYHGGFGNTKGKKIHAENLNGDRQGKHIVGHKNYSPGKSIFSGSVQDAANLVKKFSGKGTSVGVGRERIDFGRVIGYYVDQETGQSYPTTVGIIHTSKKGKHIVPARPKDHKGE